uniref:vitellogenin-2-like n=1 Tax=Monopterus albus TaxID=43700 RepID=UPI0009B472AA
VGVRAEGLQEALLKVPAAPEDADRITKMKNVLKALSQWRATPSRQPLASMSVKLFGQELAFADIDKVVVDQIVELATGPGIHSNSRKVLDAVLSGVALSYVKPMLLAELRRILPTTVGLPMELSFYTAAVVAASVTAQATVTPPVPQNFHLAQLLKSDINVRLAATPSAAIHTYAVMGVNTAFIQASVMTKARVHTIVPAKIEARFDMTQGNFKFDFLPVPGINKLASVNVETIAVARNVEDLAAARITPMLPVDAATQTSRTALSSRISRLASSLAGGMSGESSELIPNELSRRFAHRLKAFKIREKKMCATLETLGLKACTEIESHKVAFIRDNPLYTLIGRHNVSVEIAPAAGPGIEKIELEIQVGDKAAEKIIRVINENDEKEILEDKTVLMKLQRILVPGLKNSTSSSRSSSSRSSTSSVSSKSSSSSSSRHSKGDAVAASSKSSSSSSSSS